MIKVDYESVIVIVKSGYGKGDLGQSWIYMLNEVVSSWTASLIQTKEDDV